MLYQNHYLVNYEDSWDKLSQGSTFTAVSGSDIKNLKFQFPPLKEQEKIADILSTADAKIDAIQIQIDRAETLKKGLLQKLLSEGIGHSDFKDSELGKIPASWEIVKFHTVCDFISVGIATSTSKHCESDGIPLIRNQNILENKFNLSDLLYITNSFDEENKNKTSGNNIILKFSILKTLKSRTSIKTKSTTKLLCKTRVGVASYR